MGPAREDRFSYRRNADGSYDSICLMCFLTVGSDQCREMLAAEEARHQCPAGTVLNLATTPKGKKSD